MERSLTVLSNGLRLEEGEAILALESWDLP